MVILAASICTRGGKAVLSRQFREMPRSRIEALLASFPKLADSGTQHTIAEHENVRFVYQPLDELYLVLITNRQSNILQDIDSLHIFVQVITNACRILDERDVLKNAYELLSTFDELAMFGYRENLSINQIKTFLDMESHEERIQEIIAKNKELEATEERKRKAKQLEIQRRESARSGRGIPSKPKGFPSYQMSLESPVVIPVGHHETARMRMTTARTGKGMQLSRKSKTSDIFEQVRGDFIDKVDHSSNNTALPASQDFVELPAPSTPGSHGIHVTISEIISARLTREGTLANMAISGDLSLRVFDADLSKIKLSLQVMHSHGCQFRTHPNVDRALFNSDKIIQMCNQSRGFPLNNTVGVLRWRASPNTEDISTCPITFTVWSSRNTDKYSVTIEYELTGGVVLEDVSLLIPYTGSEPVVSSLDAAYELSSDAIEWKIGSIDHHNANCSFEFEATSGVQNDFFPMIVNFNRKTPTIGIDVVSIKLVDVNPQQELSFTKDIRCYAEHFTIE